MVMQILGPLPRPAESETLGVEPALCISMALQMILGHAKAWGPLGTPATTTSTPQLESLRALASELDHLSFELSNVT